MTAATKLRRDQRGVGTVQTLVVTVGLALASIAGVKALSGRVGSRAECAGDQIKTLEAVARCNDDGAPAVAASVTETILAPPAQGAPNEVAPQPNTGADSASDEGGGGDQGEPPEVDPKQELLDILADLVGITDAVKCVTEGDILACALTALNFTPGKVFGLGFKLISKATKIRKAVSRFIAAGRRAKKAEDEARRLEEAAQAARRLEEAAKRCKGGKCDKPNACFAAGTAVLARVGLVPIDQLAVGDEVWSRDDETGEEGYRPVVRRFVTPGQPLLELDLEDASGAIETLEVTAPHPFFVSGAGWVSAGELRPGDEVDGADGAVLRIADSRETGAVTTVYNLEVDEFHTYFVGESGAWVHNDCPEDVASGTAGGERAGKPFTPAGKRKVIDANKARNEGKTKCERCGVETVPAKKSQRGEVPPRNETQVDHKFPQSKGGDGAPSNGQVLCRGCNRDKSNKLE